VERRHVGEASNSENAARTETKNNSNTRWPGKEEMAPNSIALPRQGKNGRGWRRKWGEPGKTGTVVEKGGAFLLCGGSSRKQVAQLGTLLFALHLPLIWIPPPARFIELEPPLSLSDSLGLAGVGMHTVLEIQTAGHEG
jgi:hypothetical protein